MKILSVKILKPLLVNYVGILLALVKKDDNKEIRNMDYFVDLAHYDNEMLGVGAAIHKFFKEGHKIAVSILVSQTVAREDGFPTMSVKRG